MSPRNRGMTGTARITLLVALAALVATGGVWAQAQAKPKLIIIRFMAGDGITDAEAKQINEVFESKVIISGVFEVIDRTQALAIAKSSALPESFSDIESGLVLARAAGAAFIVVGTMTVSGPKGARQFTINPRLAATDTGKEALSKPVSFAEKNKLPGLEDLAVRVATAARQRSDVTKAQIEAFMTMGDWDNAERFLEIFERSRTSPDDIKVAAALRLSIDTEIAEARFIDARRALDLFLYDEARRAIGQAKGRNPENQRYLELESLIESENAQRTASDDNKVMIQIDDLVASGRWDSATALLSYLESRGSRDSRIGRQRELVNNGLKARDMHLSAKADLEAGDYESALLSINTALTLFPDNVDYLRTKNGIVAEEKREAASRAKWELYFEELKHIDMWGLFLVHKTPRVQLYTGLEYPELSYRVPQRTDTDWIPYETTESIGATGWYQGRLWSPRSFPLSSSAFSTVWLAGVRGGSATLEKRYEANQTIDTTVEALPYAWSSSMTFFSSELFGSTEARLTFLSWTVSLGAELGTGFQSASFGSSVPYLGIARVRTETYWRLSTGLRYGLTWIPVPSLQVFLLGRTTYPLLVGKGESVDEPVEHAVSIGIAIPLRL